VHDAGGVQTDGHAIHLGELAAGLSGVDDLGDHAVP
jgi:hypothetical protein